MAECRDEELRARAGVFECVYHCGPLGNCKKGKVPRRLLSKRTSPSSATSPKVCLFQCWHQGRKAGREKGNDCFTGRHWSIVNAACSFSWPVTCIVVGLLVWGGQTAGGTAGVGGGWGGGGWRTAGPIWGEREESESMRERGNRKLVLGGGGRRGKRRRGQKRGLRSCSPFTGVSSVLLRVSLGRGMTHSSRHLAAEKVLAELAGVHPLCVFAVLLWQKTVWGGGGGQRGDYPPASKYMSGWI